MPFFKNTKFILVIIILMGAFLRFYKLDWGQGLFTHPDEYHIIISVNQLSFPSQMNPHFFSYGTVTIYLIYFTKELLSATSLQLSNISPFLIGRFYSALFSTFTILFIFKITSFFLTKRYALLASLLTALLPGLIQQAHFATPESNLIFFLFGSLLFQLYFLKNGKLFHLLLASFFLGLALGVKISGAVFLLPLLITILIRSWPSPLKIVKDCLVSGIVAVLTFFIAAPFVFLDYTSFLTNFNYEGNLAAGQISVFYTRQFISTTPFLFQLEKILPFTLGPAVLIFGLLGFLCMLITVFQRKNPLVAYHLLLITFLALFISNGILFAKWTRFISPTFPFFAMFSVFLIYKLVNDYRIQRSILIRFLIITTFFWTTSFFSIYRDPDVRIIASDWVKSNIPPNSTILVENGNMINVPLGGDYQILPAEFYNLEEDFPSRDNVLSLLEKSDYFIVQSRRVFLNHSRLPNIYPKTASFYKSLFDGNFGFEEIKQFNSYPKFSLAGLKIEFPDEGAEETWSVFDHPVIRIFKKNDKLTKEEYAKFLEN